MLMAPPPTPGTSPFLPSLLAHVRSATTPGFPFDPLIVQVLLLSIISGDKNLILRTRDQDVTLVSKLTTLALSTIFGYNTHRLKCTSNTATQTPSEFLRSLFFAISTITPPAHKPRHRRVSNSRNPAAKSPIAPSISISTRTSISRSASHPIELNSSFERHTENTDPIPSIGYFQRPFNPSRAHTDTSVPTLASSGSRGDSEALKFPSVVVVSGLELASLPCQKAVLRTLADRKIILSESGIFGHDHDGLTLELPDGFFMVYVCRSDPRERPPIYKCLLDRFAMSSSVDVGAQTRLAMRQFRPSSTPSTTMSSSVTSTTSAAFPTPHSPSSLPSPLPCTVPVIPSTFIQQLKHLCVTQARIRPPLSIYLADLFSATRHYRALDGMLLTVRARQDAEALVRASRVLGTDRTGAELVREQAQLSRETASTSTYPHSQPSMASTSSDGLIDGVDAPGTYGFFAQCAASQLEPLALDVSEADIARMFPRVVSHRIRVRDSPFDEILSSAVYGATSLPGNKSHEEVEAEWERETVKDILVHILAEV